MRIRQVRRRSIKEITIHENINMIETGAFEDCDELQVVNVIGNKHTENDLKWIFGKCGGGKGEVGIYNNINMEGLI